MLKFSMLEPILPFSSLPSSVCIPSSAPGSMSNFPPIKIPRIIIQTVKSKDNIPTQWLPSQKSIKSVLSHWEYKLFDDSDNRELVKEVCPEYLPYYDTFEFAIERVDFVRSVYMTKFGGIYMDSDYEVLKPLDELFQSGSDLYFVKSGNIGTFLTNSFFASVPGHPFWDSYRRDMIKSNPWWAVGRHLKVMCQTGPIKLTWSVNKFQPSYDLLPQKLIIPCSVCDVGHCDTSLAYLAPLQGSSWCGWDSHVLIYLFCNLKKILFGLIVLIIVIIGIVIWLRSRK